MKSLEITLFALLGGGGVEPPFYADSEICEPKKCFF